MHNVFRVNNAPVDDYCFSHFAVESVAAVQFPVQAGTQAPAGSQRLPLEVELSGCRK